MNVNASEVGDTLEAAIWLDGRETVLERSRFVLDAEDALYQAGARHGRVLGSVRWSEKRPGDDRVPPVPEHIQGPNVRLLVAEATVVNVVGVERALPGFAHDLELDDLARLRRVTRRQYRREYPDQPELTDRQCDTLINDLGPAAAVDTLRSLKPSDLH